MFLFKNENLINILRVMWLIACEKKNSPLVLLKNQWVVNIFEVNQIGICRIASLENKRPTDNEWVMFIEMDIIKIEITDPRNCFIYYYKVESF